MSIILQARNLLHEHPELIDASRTAQEVAFFKRYHHAYSIQDVSGPALVVPFTALEKCSLESPRRAFQKINKRQETKKTEE